MPVYRINYGDAIIDGGLFLRRQTDPAGETLSYVDGRGSFFEHLSTFPGRSTIKEAILDRLRAAQRHIFFASFLIQDDEVTEALIQSAKRLKGHVYVLTTLKESDFDTIRRDAAEEAEEENKRDFQAHMRHIGELTKNGISVKARKDCHAKFMVADDKYAIVTSANAAPTCYVDIDRGDGTIRPANAENGVLLKLPAEVYRLGNFFRGIWRSGINYALSPDPQVVDISELAKETLPIVCSEPAPADEGHVLWTAPNDCRILSAIVRMINEADDRVRISSYGIKGIEHHALGKALAEAAKRGVEVEILVRRMPRERLRSCCQLDSQLGDRLAILADLGNHSKAAVVDDKAAMVMTANLDTEHGLDSGVEVGFYSRRRAFVKAVSGFLDELEGRARLEFVSRSTQEQVCTRSGARANVKLGKDLHLRISPTWRPGDREQMVERLVSEIGTGLVRMGDSGSRDKSRMLLLTDGLVVRVLRESERQLIVTEIEATPGAAFRTRSDGYLPRTSITISVE